MNTPSPDAGEEHQHVNTQLYGSIDPLTNRGLLARKMTAPYNAPADLLLQPTMDGFVADCLSPVFSLDAPRDPDGWPEVSPRPVPPYAGQIPAPDAALRGLGKAAFHACSALATHLGKPSPALTQDEDITRANGAALLNELVGDVFVRLRDS